MNTITLNSMSLNNNDYLTLAVNEQQPVYNQYARPTFCESFINCFKYKYINFSGRTRRSEYWQFQGWVMIMKGMSLLATVGMFFLARFLGYFNILHPIMLFIIANVIISVAQTSSSVRRVHDTGRSGVWVWLFIIPLVMWYGFKIYYAFLPITGGFYNMDYETLYTLQKISETVAFLLLADMFYGIYLTVIMCLDSEKGDNRYGESEKYITA